jgi:hypothetical protein
LGIREITLALEQTYRIVHPRFSKDILRNADLISMVNPISSVNANSTNQINQQAARPPQPAAQASSAVPQDKVTLKSTGDRAAGDPDHDGH